MAVGGEGGKTVECSVMWWVVGSTLHDHDGSITLFLQSVFHSGVTKAMVCTTMTGMVHVLEPLLWTRVVHEVVVLAF